MMILSEPGLLDQLSSHAMEKKLDLHTLTAGFVLAYVENPDITGQDYLDGNYESYMARVTPEQRTATKAALFGYLYGGTV